MGPTKGSIDRFFHLFSQIVLQRLPLMAYNAFVRTIPLLLVASMLISFGVYTASVIRIPSETILDYSDSSSVYIDAPFKEKETVAISLLTNIKAVSGYHDNSFRPNRRLGRAEALKIIIASHPDASGFVWGPIGCFLDVQANDWFSPYVCAAKERGIVRGYGDGRFDPGRAVSYAEAVKMLVELYAKDTSAKSPDISLQEGGSEIWYQPYIETAKQWNVLLIETIPYDQFLTRGEMARLVAAFRSMDAGELDVYRTLENVLSDASQGHEPMYFSSSSDPLPVTDKPLEEKNKEPEQFFVDISARSRFLLLGQESLAIADGVFMFADEDARVRIVEVIFDKEVKSFKELIIIDSQGKTFDAWPLRLYPLDTTQRTWRIEYEIKDAYILPKDTPVHLAVVADLWERGNRGISDELVEVRSFTLMAQGIESNTTRHILPKKLNRPFHQTVQSKLTGVTALPVDDSNVHEGRRLKIASFAFQSKTPDDTAVQIRQIKFNVDKQGVRVINWEIARLGDIKHYPCFIETIEEDEIFCPGLPDDFVSREDADLVLTVSGDVTFIAASSRYLQVSLESAGGVGETGSVFWSDRTGDFIWVELPEPLAIGTRWE
jgi:hypothetical protein